jgi:hypothetical protein
LNQCAGQCFKRKGDEGVQFLLSISLGNNPPSAPPSHDNTEGLDHSDHELLKIAKAEPAAIDTATTAKLPRQRPHHVGLPAIGARSKKSPRQ